MRWESTAAMPEAVVRESVEAVAAPVPLTAAALRGLGIRGVQFGSLDRLFPAPCLNSDIVEIYDLTARETLFGRLYRVDGRYLYLRADALQEMPIEGGALSWAYAEHFLEHITPEEAVRWLREVRRLLAPGGVVRVTTPDLARYVRGYLEESDAFYALHRERTARLGFPPMETRKAWMLNQIFQYWGHRWIYDADEVRHVMRQAGFEPERVTVQTYGRSREPEMAGLDWEIRNDDTLYVEAVA